jgi:hypothetical protein
VLGDFMRIENENDYEKALERRKRLWDSGFCDACDELSFAIEGYELAKIAEERERQSGGEIDIDNL